MNVMVLNGNPYLQQWCDAAQAGGAELDLLSWRRALGWGGTRPDWVHLQWPERSLRAPTRRRAALGAARLLAATGLARAGRARVLVTAHNTLSHEARHPRLERLLWTALVPLVTDLHVMTAAGAETFLAEHPGLRGRRQHVVPHGDYLAQITVTEVGAAREALGLPSKGQVFVAFGALRGYKGINELLDAWADMRDPDAVLVVAGRVLDDALADRLANTATTDRRLVLREGFLPDDELALHISAADWVLLPYRRVLNSGSLLLALSLGRPVVVPDTPTFREIGAQVGPEWVRHHNGHLTAGFLAGLGAPPPGHPDLSWCSWNRISEQLRTLFSVRTHRQHRWAAAVEADYVSGWPRSRAALERLRSAIITSLQRRGPRSQ